MRKRSDAISFVSWLLYTADHSYVGYTKNFHTISLLTLSAQVTVGCGKNNLSSSDVEDIELLYI